MFSVKVFRQWGEGAVCGGWSCAVASVVSLVDHVFSDYLGRCLGLRVERLDKVQEVFYAVVLDGHALVNPLELGPVWWHRRNPADGPDGR
jgi:hypothetical protein